MRGLEVSIVRITTSRDVGRLDPQFFKKRYVSQDRALERHQRPTLGSFSFVTDGPHGYHEVDDSSPIAMLTAKSASDWFANRQGADTIAERTHEANRRSSLSVDDLLLSTRGTVGNCAVVTEEALPANIDQDVARIALTRDGRFHPLFLLAYLNGRFGRNYIERHSSGMVQQGLPLAAVRAIPVPLLPARFQTRIAAVVDAALESKRDAQRKLAGASTRLLSTLGAEDWAPPEPLTYTAGAAQIRNHGRLDAQYFMPAKQHVLRSLANISSRALGDHADAVRDLFLPAAASAGMLVRNYDVTDALRIFLDGSKPPALATSIGSAKKALRNGDVVISRLRAYLQEIAVVCVPDDVLAVGSSEFVVLRAKAARPEVGPEALMLFLRSRPVQTVLKWCQDGSQHPRFGADDLLSIPVPDVLLDVSETVTQIVRDAFAAQQQARLLLRLARDAVELAVEEGERKAIAYLVDSGVAR